MFKYEDVVLLDSDIDTLRGPCFLTDQVIAFYFSYLSSSYKSGDILLVTPSMSLWLANCTDDKTISDFAESCKLSTKRLVFFAVNDCEDFDGGDGGNHWSILFYDRTMNAFVHFDSMDGVNNIPAKKLYDALKNYMGSGGQVSRPQTSKKKKDKKKSAQSVSKPIDVAHTAPAGLPIFMEWEKTPQQSNGYDCGLYVLSIAEVICHWFEHEITKIDMFSAIAKHVDQTVEVRMRSKVLDIIQELSSD